MKLISRISIFTAALVLMLCTLSCEKVHQFPEPGKEVDPTVIGSTVKIALHIGMEGQTVITKAADPIDVKKESADKYDRRFFVEIRNGEYNDDLVESYVRTRPATDNSPLVINTNLHSRKYVLVVWTDFVRKGETTDLYFKTENGGQLSAIKILDREQYVAGTDFKDSQHCLQDIDLTPYAGQWYQEVTIESQLHSPMAKIRFLANDLQEYASSISWTRSLEELAESMHVEFVYNGYLPTGFNALTGRLNNSDVGYTFNHNCWYPETFRSVDYTLVGSDYVFVNGESSSVTVSAIIRDDDGNIVNQVNSVQVPIYRGQETVVLFKFFTKEYVPGIGINPDFDGEFNIYV